MELCVAKQSPAIANLSTHRHKTHKRAQSLLPLRRPLSLPSSKLISSSSSGLLYSSKIRATSSEEGSGGPNDYDGMERDGPITLEAVPPGAKNAYSENVASESPQEEAPVDGQMQSSTQEETPMGGQQPLGFLDNLDIQFDSVDSYSILLYGTGALVVLWLASAIVGAIDSIPLIPKLLEVVGLGYTVWFSWRYLIFKKNREELGAKIDNLKQEVLGSKED